VYLIAAILVAAVIKRIMSARKEALL